MKTRKIVSLLLAVLMVLSALPMAFMTVSAAETAATAGTAGTAPATLPDGRTYAGVPLLKDSFDLMALYQEKQTSSWVDATNTPAEATTMLRDGAAGVMFKIDATDKTVASTTFPLTFVIQIKLANGKSTYLCATARQASVFEEAATPSVASGSWYYSKDGASWNTIEVAGDTRYVNVPVDKDVTYVYVPMTSFWFKSGKTFLTTGTNVKTETVVSWAEGKEYIGNDFTIGMTNFYFGGNFTDNVTAAQDAAVKATEWRLVDVEGAPTTLPEGGYYTTTPMFKNDSYLFSYGLNNGAWVGNIFSSDAVNALNNANGFMFKIDASAVASGNDYYQVGFDLNIQGNNGVTQYFGNIGQVMIHGNATKPEGATTVCYFSADGVTWTKNASDARYYATNASNRDEIYVYFPFETLYTRHGITYLQGGAATKTDLSLSWYDAKEVLGGFKAITNICIRFNDSTINRASMSEFRFVYASDVAPTPAPVPQLPELPVVGETMILPFIAGELTRPSWTGGGRYLATAKQNFIDSDGLMFELDPQGCADIAQFTLMLACKTPLGGNGGNNYFLATAGKAKEFGNAAVPADAVSTWYVSADGKTWEAITADTSLAMMNMPALSGKVYVYVPFDSFWSRYDADYISGKTTTADKTKPSCQFDDFLAAMDGDNFEFAYIHAYWGSGPASTTCTLSNYSFVQMDRKMSEIEKAPVNDPVTGDAYTTFPLLAPDYNEIKYAESGTWQGKIFAHGVSNVFNTADGIMLKVDANGVAAGTSVASFGFAMSVTGNNGVSTYICSSLGQATTYGNTKNPNDGSTSTWYISNDGATWTAVTTPDRFHGTSAQRGTFYVYIPTSAMYVRHGETYLGGGADVTTETTVTYARASEIVGGWKSLNNFALWFNDSTINKGLTLSEFVLVGTDSGLLSSASVTLTDDLAYNVYADVPAGATDVTVTFTMNGKTYRVSGVKQANGKTKYTFANILPQQMDDEITVSITATVDGKTVSDSYTTSIEDYARSILDHSAYSNWHDLIKAMLHYGAAAQTVAGDAGELVNKDVAGVTVPADLTKLPQSYANGNSAIWTSAALRLDNAIALKIGVNAPAGITEVIYSVGDRTGIVAIENGYVYVPVYAYELMEEVTVACYNGKTATADGALKISASYYLAIVNASTDAMKALVQAIADYAVEATLIKGNREAAKPSAPTLAQIELSDDGGMAYVIQMTDGRFILIDGGTSDTMNTENLWEYLVVNSNYTKPVIAAWMFTHQDGDHTNNAFKMLNSFAQKMEVQSFAYDWPTVEDFAILDTDSDYVKSYKEDTIAQIESKTPAFNNILAKYPNATAWDMASSESRMIGDVKIEVILTVSDKIPSNPMEANDLSAVWKMTFTQGTESTADDTTFMVLGDSSEQRTASLAEDFSSTFLKCDVLQAAHHGLYGGDKSTYQMIAPEITLVPTYQARFEQWFTGASKQDYNVWLYANSDCYHASQTTVVNMKDLTVSIWD